MEKPKYTLDFEEPLQQLENQLQDLRSQSQKTKVDFSEDIQNLEKKLERIKEEVYSNLTAWQKVQLARHPQRPYALDYIEAIFQDFQELHGDRLYKDDGATVGGPAIFDGQPVMVLGQQKGRTTKEKLKRNFGSPNPEGYRKALRLMEMAERFKMPIISLIDTPGAYPGIGAEERHVAEAIAVNIREMSQLTVPIIAAVIGEGGSGGALGVGVADRVLIMENAYYSVISPEGCAMILWKERSATPKAAEALKLSAEHLLKLGIVDEILDEPLGGAHCDFTKASQNLESGLKKHLKEIQKLDADTLLAERYERFRKIGEYTHLEAPAKDSPVTA